MGRNRTQSLYKYRKMRTLIAITVAVMMVFAFLYVPEKAEAASVNSRNWKRYSGRMPGSGALYG